MTDCDSLENIFRLNANCIRILCTFAKFSAYEENRIPLCLQYRYEFPDGISLLAYTGPTFHYGIVSFLKREASATLVGHQWSIGGGMQYRRLQFRLTGDIPLWQYFLDINAHESGIEVKSPLTFSLSYLF